MSNYSPKLPLTQNSENGFENNQTIPAVVNQNLKMILLTSPGERIMDTNFGVGIKRFLFEQNNPQTYGKIRARVNSQVNEYMPFVSITDVSFGTEANNDNIMSNGLLITITYFIKPLGVEDTLSLTV